MIDFGLFGVFGDRQTIKQTDIGDCRATFTTENQSKGIHNI